MTHIRIASKDHSAFACRAFRRVLAHHWSALPLQVTARLDAAAVPLMEGALHCSASGIASSLLPDNLKAAAAVENTDEAARLRTWPLLFDPQTSGGLLAGCVL